MPPDLDFLLFILKIIFIDIMLGGDNAIVIALACRRLPDRQRNLAIVIGTGLAVVVRIGMTAIVVSLLNIPYLLLVGGLFLLIIAYRLITTDGEEEHRVRAGTTTFSAIRTIVFADLIMGLDNMLAIAGAAKGHIGLIAIGLMISVPVIIWGSRLILAAMEKFPVLIYAGGGVLVYTASEMILEEPKLRPFFAHHQDWLHYIPPVLIAAFLIVGWMANALSDRSQPDKN